MQQNSVETDHYVQVSNTGENFLMLDPIFLSYEPSKISYGSVMYYWIDIV